jgi:ATP-dependent Clp protease ATP-binding subunit ClpB
MLVASFRLRDMVTWLKNGRIFVDVDAAAKDWLVRHGYSEVYGARAIARVARSDVLFPFNLRSCFEEQ